MAKPAFTDGLIKALTGILAVYLLILIARAGYDVGQVLAGRMAMSEAVARVDVFGLALLSALGLLLHQRKSP